MIKYCFFDIDGVLNTTKDWSLKYSFNKKLVELFCIFLKKYNIQPIMTSSWRIGFEAPGSDKNLPHIKVLEAEFLKHGIVICGKTPVLKGRSRDIEIERYLHYHPADKYIILDDDPAEFKKITNNNIFTDSNIGFNKHTYRKAEKLIKQ